MSIDWAYQVWFPGEQILSASQIAGVLQRAQRYGFRPSYGFRLLASLDAEEIQLNNIDATVDWLGQKDGISTLRDDQDDPVFIDLYFPGISELSSFNTEISTFKKLTLYIQHLYYKFHKNNSERLLAIANSIKQLYADLCTDLTVPYGAAWSDYDYEEIVTDLYTSLYGPRELIYEDEQKKQLFQALMNGERHYREVHDRQPPGVLFWLQYFSNDYAKNIDLAACVQLGGKIEKLPQGIFLSFFDYPWQVRQDQLLTINRQWRALYPDTLRLTEK